MFDYTHYDETRVEFIEVAEINEIPSGERLFLEIDDLSLIVFNIAGSYFAIDNVCSHDYGSLGEGEVEGHSVICPRHGARFDMRNGKALSLPAVEDISAYPVRVVEDHLEVGIPIE